MKNNMKTILVMLLLGCALTGMAQEYEVKSLQLDENDQSAVTNGRKDLSDQPCALVKVLTGDPVMKVDGNVVGDVLRKGSYSWVYVTDGTKRSDLHFKDHLSISKGEIRRGCALL